jgi:exodeoxyribonuclease VII small subunit
LTDSPDPQQRSAPPNFEAALERLEHIVRQLEEGDVGLAEALAHYEQGVSLLKKCYQLLENAERRIELLSEVDAASGAVTEPFDDQATHDADQPAASRGRKRTKRASKSGPTNGDAPEVLAENDVDESGGLF